jgi:ankyrin repeat protein
MIHSAKVIPLVIAITWFAVPVSKMQDSSQPSINVELRLAETRYAAGLTEAVVAGKGDKVYLQEEAAVTDKDILHAEFILGDTTGDFGVVIAFTAEGGKKIANATRGHLNKPLALLLDGKVVAAQQANTVIQHYCRFTGLPKADADRIAKAISMYSVLALINHPGHLKLEIRLAQRGPAKGLIEAVEKNTLHSIVMLIFGAVLLPASLLPFCSAGFAVYGATEPRQSHAVPPGTQLAEALARRELQAKKIEFREETFFKAVYEGDFQLTQLFLAAGMKADAKGETALFCAVQRERAEVVKLLCSAGAKVNARNRFGETPLTLAVETRNLELVRTLLALGADPKLRSVGGATALMHAAASGSTDVIELLLIKGGEVNQADERGQTPLMLAVGDGNDDAVALLLNRGANPRAVDESGMTVLMHAVRGGDLSVVERLIKAGVNLNARNKEGRTAIMIAAARGDEEVGRVLKRAGADETKESALMLAVGANDLDGVLKAIAGGANANAVADQYGWTALLMASRAGYTEVVRALLSHGADPNAKDKVNGYVDSCLMQASSKGHLEIVEALLGKGAKVNDANQDGYTALMYASWFDHLEVAKLLLKAGADSSARAKNGDTALKLADKNGHGQVVVLLRGAEKKK